jgi:hypothetical protein
MAIVDYTPELFGALQQMVAQLEGTTNLSHRPFVDYYYASHSRCKLYLCLSDSGTVLGTLGRELLRFEYKSEAITFRFGSNWNSRTRGVGGQLATFSAESNPNSIGVTFMATKAALQRLRYRGCIFAQGIRGYFLNGPCSLYPGHSWWRRGANSMIRNLAGKKISSYATRIPSHVIAGMAVREERSYSEDLLPTRSPFTFRLAPTIEYLSWRYNLSLGFVQYRLFRILSGGTTVGYVILNESPDQIIVAQSDGEDSNALAYGTLLSILEIARDDQKPRTVFLACAHRGMRRVFESFGFRQRPGQGDLPFAFRTLPPGFDASPDTSNWLINFDWSDNGLLGLEGVTGKKTVDSDAMTIKN